jgi:SAM-dependent methyltransferase
MEFLENMTPEAKRACPVCAGRRVGRLHHQRFVLEEGHPLADGYDVAHCVSCGFVYAEMTATQADYDAFYTRLSKYDDPASSTGSGESPLDRQRLEETADILVPLMSSAESRILDIGCAGGGLLAALQQRGFRRLVGIDPSPACARATRARIGEAYQGWLTNLPSGLENFDCITLSHVMEHVLDLAPAVAALPDRLRPNGLVYVEVPDASRYADYVFAPFQDFNTEHINHFSRHCLDHVMGRHGFRAIGGGERLLRPSAHTFTPAVYAIYRWTGERIDLGRDTRLEPAIQLYIHRSAAYLRRIDHFLAETLSRSPELLVWGVGQLTLKLLAETQLGQAKVVAFVDSNPIHQGKRLAGKPILSPDEIRSLSQPILIATLLHDKEIAAQISRSGLINPILVLPKYTQEKSTSD